MKSMKLNIHKYVLVTESVSCMCASAGGLEGLEKSTSGNKVVTIIGLCFLCLLLVLIVLQLYKNHRRVS